MYASQTKRLCVRGAPSDETTRAQHNSPESSEAANNNQESNSSTSSSSISTTVPVSATSVATSSVQSTKQSVQQRNTSSISPSSTAISDKQTTIVVSNNMTASAMSDNSNTNQPSTTTLSPSGSPFLTRDHHNNHLNSNTITNNSSVIAAAAVAAANISDDTSESDLINRLATETIEETRLEIILSIRNLITACNKKKNSIVNNPNFSKIINIIDDDQSTSPMIKAQLALMLCSIAKGGENNVKLLNELMVDDKIYKLILRSQDLILVESSLRCMRSLMSWPRVSRTWILYDNQLNGNMNTNKETSNDRANGCSSNLQRIISYAQESNSFTIQECVSDIFANTCNRSKDQTLLYKASALSCIVKLLESRSYRVIISSLNWLIQMCLKNQIISSEVIQTKCPSGTLVLDRLITLMNKDKCHDLQFLSARCYAHIYRALGNDQIKNDPRIISHVLPTLVRMVHKDKSPHLRIKSAECIAYLIESDTPLQDTASFCDHLIDSLANMLEYEHNSTSLDSKLSSQNSQYKLSRVQDRGVSWLSIAPSQQPEPPALDLRPLSQIDTSIKVNTITSATPTLVSEDNDNNSYNGTCNNNKFNQEMKRAAFLALASLASNLEPIRTKIFNTCSVMQNLVKSLTDSDTKTLKSVLTCLLSLSRSVQQLRTSFAENSVYSALKSLLSTTSNDVLILVLAILCNISLDFSPGKQHFLDSKTIDLLCNLTRRSDSILRLHGMWILMNMVYQLKDQNLKFQILRSLDINHLLNLLETEEEEEIVLKTLGFLRNLLSQKLHIDAIMKSHGETIMQSLLRMLEKPCSAKIKEHTLCVLTNIADGTESKAFIMKNKIILNYISRIMSDEQGGDLRLAAICCITNLAHRDYEGSYERRDEMKKFGIEEKLKSMLDTNDPALSDRVRTAYSYFYS